MSDIPNTEYITVKADGVFVGGKPATHYRGEEIYHIERIMNYFKKIRSETPNLLEVHTLTSKIQQVPVGRAGNPVSQDGPNYWLRVKMMDGFVGPWVRCDKIGEVCVCASYCIEILYEYNCFRYATFGFHYPIPEIPNTEYVTVKRGDGNQVDIYIGNKKAIKYHDLEIMGAEETKEFFAKAQEQMPQIEELHALSSETKDKDNRYLPGMPSGKAGRYVWCRIKFHNKPNNFAPWVFFHEAHKSPLNALYGVTDNAIMYCANECAYSLRFPNMVESMSDCRFIKNPDKNSSQKIIEAQINSYTR